MGVTMSFSLFGNKNLKTAEELRHVGQRKPTVINQDWALDEVDALRVPILSGPQLVYSSNSQRRWNARCSKQVGVYSPSANYCEAVARVLSLHNVKFQCFGYSEQTQGSSFQAFSNIDAWLVNVLDEDESLLLDKIMSASSEVSSLFLFDKVLSRSCVKKLESFIEDSDIFH